MGCCEGGTWSAVGELWATDDERGMVWSSPRAAWVPFRQLELRVSSLPPPTQLQLKPTLDSGWDGKSNGCRGQGTGMTHKVAVQKWLDLLLDFIHLE